MGTSTSVRKPLSVRATPEQHRVLADAAAKQHRSLNSFILNAALEAAQGTQRKVRRSPEEIKAIFKAARDEFQALNPGRDALAEFLADRRAEAERE